MMCATTAAVLRPAAAADYVVLCGWVGSQAEADLFIGPHTTRYPLQPQRLCADLHKADIRSRVLCDAAGQMVAFGQYWPRDPGRTHLGRLVVDPARRGEGWCGLLLQMLMAEARRDSGLATVALRVYRHNRRACALYRRAGFVEVPAELDAELMLMTATVAA